jgi:hypothetical protein
MVNNVEHVIRVAIYTRVSSQEQAEKGTSLESQAEQLEGFCKAQKWELLIGIATIRIAKTWWLKMAGILLPLLMFVTIVATANHFILDAIVGAAVAGLSYELSLLFAKLIKHGVSPDLISTTIIFCQILSALILRLNGIVVLCSRLEVVSSLALSPQAKYFCY